MAQKNRADILALINAYTAKTDNFITTNGNREISGAKLNEILNDNGALLNDIKDSYYNLLDDLADAVRYTPAVNADWNAIPTEVKGGLDQLAERVRIFETNNASQKVAYVSTTGSDVMGEFEIGNELKPFATFAAALLALGSSNFKLVVLPGTYTEVLNLSSKTNFTIDLQSVVLNNSINCFNSQNGVFVCYGANINGKVDLSATNSENISYFGGKITSSTNGVVVGEGTIVDGVIISATSSSVNSSSTTDINRKAVVRNCVISSVFSLGTIYRCPGTIFINCNITGVRCWSSEPTGATAGVTTTFFGCTLVASGDCMRGENNIMNGNFINCRIESTSALAVFIAGSSNYLFFTNCTLIGATSTVQIGSVSRQVGTNNVFQNCKMYAGTGNIFIEPSYGSDFGDCVLINTTINKSTITAVAPVKIQEFGTISIVGLQQPSI